MAKQIRTYQPTIPAGTPKTALFTSDMSFPAMVVTEIDIRIPSGPRGQVGFAIGSAGQPVLPFAAGQFIIGDDELIKWPLEDLWDSGSWTFFGYNTGVYNHTIYVTFLLDLVQGNAAPVAPVIANSALSSPPGTSTGQPVVIGGVLMSVGAPTPALALPVAPA